jgi:hypothetical protein
VRLEGAFCSKLAGLYERRKGNWRSQRGPSAEGGVGNLVVK